MVTPPVALAAYAAGNIVGANVHRVGFTAMKLGIVAYLVPFMFVYGPSLLLIGTLNKIILSIITALIGVTSLAIAQQGWFMNSKVNITSRILFLVAALLLIKTGITTDLAGMGLVITGFLIHRYFSKK